MYENYDVLNEDRVRRRNLFRAYRRSIRDFPRVSRFRGMASRCPLTPLKDTRPLLPDDVPLIMSVRNELSRLPPFLRHYRSLGVTRFLVVDDQSSDGSREFLIDQPDTEVHESDIRFQAANCGTMWHYALAQRYGFGRWYVVVDADEYLVYPGMEGRPLPAVFDWLDRNGMRRLLAPMIDLFPVGRLADAHFNPDGWPWEVATHFDLNGYFMRARSVGPLVAGGAAERILGSDHLLQKYPIIFWDRKTVHFPDIHNPYPYYRSVSRILGCLLHFKIFADLEQRALEAIDDGQHAQNASKYRAYYETVSGGLELQTDGINSVPYEGPEQLASLGMMERIRWT